MRCFRKIECYVPRRSVLIGLVCGATAALLPISAGAQCTNWDLGDQVTIIQRGVKLPISLTLVKNGRVITGNANNTVLGGVFDSGRVLNAQIDGTFDGSTFSFQIFWPDGLTGVYNGKVLPSGRLDGDTYDKNNPRIRQTWYSYAELKCQPPPVAPKILTSTGRKPSATPPIAPPTPPFITAGQPVVPTPNHPFGSVYMGWDGGPDHPNVEVFVSINNGAEVPAFTIDFAPQHPVFKQPKIAAIELKLARRSTYKFVLKSAGKTLSTAAFAVP